MNAATKNQGTLLRGPDGQMGDAAKGLTGLSTHIYSHASRPLNKCTNLLDKIMQKVVTNSEKSSR